MNNSKKYINYKVILNNQNKFLKNIFWNYNNKINKLKILIKLTYRISNWKNKIWIYKFN